MKVKVFDMEGKAVTETIGSAMFDVAMNTDLVAQGLRVQMANRRNPIAHTKTRGEVSGGGRKPFKQKGTGNARAGSTRSPLWSGGGITFGPRSVRNFKLRMPQKMTQLGIKMLLADKARENKLIVLKSFELAQISTVQAQTILTKLPIEGKILVILPKVDVNIELSLTNLPYIKMIHAENINLFDIANYDFILTTVEGIKKIEAILAGQVESMKKNDKVKEDKE